MLTGIEIYVYIYAVIALLILHKSLITGAGAGGRCR